MVKLGMVGKVLIHNYPYGAYFNGTDAKLLEERCTKKWMLEFIRGRFPEPVAKNSRITHVWAGDRKESEAIAAGCRIPTVCGSLDEVIASVDGVLILDEDIPFRAETVERCLMAGKPVFVDKTLAPTVEKTRELVTLAQARKVQIAAWSQLFFAAEADVFKGLQGGAALVTFQLAKSNVASYGVHLVCSAVGAFGSDPVRMAKVDTGSIPMVALTYADGKNVLLRAGEDVPPRGAITYVTKTKGCLTAKLWEMAPMFDRSAEALARMFEDGQPPIPPEALVRMTQAVSLLSQA